MGSAGATWDAAVRRVGGDPRGSGADLDERYAEPHRHYHTGVHVAAVVGDASWLAIVLGLPVLDQDVITLAACAHDVVYAGRPGEDERASAEWARAALAGVDADVIERVVALVLATADHEAGDDVVGQVLMDADLAILGAPPAVYAGYADAVRVEYATVPQDVWRAGRGAILRRLLDRDPLYRTEPARARWAVAARENLAVELAWLG